MCKKFNCLIFSVKYFRYKRPTNDVEMASHRAMKTDFLYGSGCRPTGRSRSRHARCTDGRSMWVGQLAPFGIQNDVQRPRPRQQADARAAATWVVRPDRSPCRPFHPQYHRHCVLAELMSWAGLTRARRPLTTVTLTAASAATSVSSIHLLLQLPNTPRCHCRLRPSDFISDLVLRDQTPMNW